MPATNTPSTHGPHALPSLSPSTVPLLLGRSNYTLWHTAIHPILTSHPHTCALLSGSWTKPRPARNSSAEMQAWEHANLSACRVVRATLAMNVLPFVRRYVEVKLLWEALVGLYGEANGIAMIGGPLWR